MWNISYTTDHFDAKQKSGGKSGKKIHIAYVAKTRQQTLKNPVQWSLTYFPISFSLPLLASVQVCRTFAFFQVCSKFLCSSSRELWVYFPMGTSMGRFLNPKFVGLCKRALPVNEWNFVEQLLDSSHPCLRRWRGPFCGYWQTNGDTQDHDKDEDGQQTPMLPSQMDACNQNNKNVSESIIRHYYS